MTTVATRAGHVLHLPSTPRHPPQRFAGFYKVERLGAGTFAEVFRAETLRGERLAIKQLRPTYRSPTSSPSSWAVRQFEQERELLSRCRSPHIVPLWDKPHDLPHAMVMKYIAGPSLDEKFKEGITDEELLQLGADVLNGLHTLHQCGYIHGDIKPQNLLWDGGRWVLIDFGAARRFGAADDDDVVCGSYGYMSPEQQRGCYVSSATDIYSWAAVMSKGLGRVRHTGLAPALGAILTKCLDPDPKERPRIGALRVLLHTYRYSVARAA